MSDEIETTETNNTPDAPDSSEQTFTPEEYQRLQANVQQFRQYEKDYKKQIADMKKQLKAFEAQEQDRTTAEADAEKARLAEQEKWKELAEKSQAELTAMSQQLQESQSEMQQTLKGQVVRDVARSLGAINENDLNFIEATGAIDMSTDEPRGEIERIIKGMVESHPYLFKPQQEKTQTPALPNFNPSGDGAQMSDAERLSRLRQLTGQGHWGMFKSQIRN